VAFDSECTDDEINQILKIIQEAGKEEGINDLPVVIVRETYAEGFIPTTGPSAETEPEHVSFWSRINAFFTEIV
jgi:hypothetical protein